ncbi:fimbrial protein [Shewanella algae]|uniref:fimbrial protein n=1 Tax=Shewanella algae TaxID=38313 RepID=UPI001C80AD5E|nr:fimbrial protein [Shewanella algae]
MKIRLLILMTSIFGMILQVQAYCYRITYDGTLSPTNARYINPDYGKNALWSGASDNNFGPIGLQNLISIAHNDFQPVGTTLAKSPSTPMTQYGQIGGFDPEQVLFRCDAGDEGQIFESYATNSDNNWSGASLVIEAGVPEHTYMLNSKNIGFRVKNETTGEYVTRNWRYRPLTNLDKDDQGKILVKAKNFSNMSLELVKISHPAVTDTFSQPSPAHDYSYTYAQPLAYSTFVGPGEGNGCAEGELGTCHIGWHYNWPGNISIHNNLTIRRAELCAFKSVTPYVRFPTISVEELKRGEKVAGQLSLSYNCQHGAVNGVGADQNAVGFKVSGEAYLAAESAGLKTSGYGVTHLLSHGYGTDPSVATGVGIELAKSDGSSMNWLSDENIISGGENDGWYPLQGEKIGSNPVSNDFLEVYNVYLSALDESTALTPGKVYATAEVFIRVQ